MDTTLITCFEHDNDENERGRAGNWPPHVELVLSPEGKNYHRSPEKGQQVTRPGEETSEKW